MRWVFQSHHVRKMEENHVILSNCLPKIVATETVFMPIFGREKNTYICVYCFHDKGRTAWNLFIKVAKFRLSINELKLRDTYIWRWDGYWVCDSSFWHNECWLLSLLLLLLFQNHRCTCVRYVRTYWQIIEEILSNKQN